MHLGEKAQQRSHLTLPLAVALIAFAVGCGEDNAGAGGAGGAGGSGTGGSATGGSAGGTGGEGGSGTAGTGGASGSGGATGTGGTAGSGASGGAAGTGGAGGSGATDAGSAGKAGAGGSSGAAGADGGGPDVTVVADPKMNFFVSSDTSKTGNLGGLTGADARCQRLAMAAGSTFGSKTWHAYLSVEAGDGGQAVNARDRIGPGPYYNAKGAMLAADSAALHARNGDAEVFVTEKSQKVNGQWSGSPSPVEHDVLTGSMGDGTVLAGQTCVNWTSEAMTDTAQVGHADGLGPSMSSAPPYNSWNASHVNGGCNDTAPKGGAGRLYCFVAQ